MRADTTWSYHPYRPLMTKGREIYICRVAPTADAIALEWLADERGGYTVLAKERNQANFAVAGHTDGGQFLLQGLQLGRDYAFYVQRGQEKSRVRLARTGDVPGTVVNYLHPEDEAYAFSGRYLCSPSLVRHPNGCLLASMDVFEAGAPQNLTLIFRSDDEGQTWHYVSELFPCFWGKLFTHQGRLYMLGCSTEYGDLLIGASDDCGKTFSMPTVLLRGSNGKKGNAGVHKNPQPVVLYGGRLWNTLEWGAWGMGFHAPMVMSAEAESDLLRPESWAFSPPVPYDQNWPGVPKGPSAGNIEGCLVEAPDGGLRNIMRYDMSRLTPNYGLALCYLVGMPEEPLAFERAMAFPANHSKFEIKRDPQTGRYLSLATRITDAAHSGTRGLLSLMVSDDLETWHVAADLIDRNEENLSQVGFQYVDFEMEGEDLIYLCRTAMNGAHNFHDSNYSTFHRVKNFRTLLG